MLIHPAPGSQWLLLVLRLLALPYFAIYFVLQGPVNDNLGAWWLVSLPALPTLLPPPLLLLLRVKQPSWRRAVAACDAARHFCPAQRCWAQAVAMHTPFPTSLQAR